jgi:hypothetical protein
MNNLLLILQANKIALIPPTVGTVGINWVDINYSQISWTAASGTITGYKVYRNGSLVATLGNVLVYQDSGLSPVSYYSYYIKAYNSAGDSSASNTVSTTTLDYGYPTINSFSVSSGGLVSWNVTKGYGISMGFTIYCYHKLSSSGTWINQNASWAYVYPPAVGSRQFSFTTPSNPLVHAKTYDFHFLWTDYSSGYSADEYAYGVYIS